MDLFDLSAKLSINSEDFEKGISGALKTVGKFGGALKTGVKTAAKVGAAAITAVGTATVGVSKTLVDGTKEVAAYGDTIDKASQKLGISAESYQEWDAILQHSGTSVGALTGVVRNMGNVFGKATTVIGDTAAAEAELEAKLESGEITLDEYNEQYDALYDGAYKNIGALSDLGFSMEEIEELSGDNDKALKEVIKRLQQMPDGAKKSALAQDLLGRSALEMGALLNTSAEDTEAMRQKVHELGGVLSDDAVKSAAAFQDSLQDLQTAFSGAKNSLMSNFMPSITTVMDGLTALLSGDESGIGQISNGINDLVTNISEQLPRVIPLITGLLENVAVVIAENVGTIVDAALNIITSVIEALVPVLPDIITTTVDVLMDNLPTLLDGAIQLFMALVTAIPEILPALVDVLPTVVETVLNNLAEPLQELFRATWKTIVSLFSIAWDGIKRVWGVVANWFNQTIVQPISNFFGNLWKNIGNAATNAWNTLKNGARAAWDGIKSIFTAIPNWFKDKFKSAWEAVKNVFSAGGRIFTGIKEGIVNAFKTVVNAIIGGINKVVAIPFNAINKVLNTLRNISILGVSPFGWISTFSVPQIPLLARGGIVNDPTLAMIGERGQEAIIPLENNTEWMRKIAQEMATELRASHDSMMEDIRATLHAILANMGVDIVLSDGVIAGRVDRILGQTAMRKMRGNA
jgi:hypothetical protein